MSFAVNYVFAGCSSKTEIFKICQGIENHIWLTILLRCYYKCILLCIMVAGFIMKGCFKYFLALNTPLRIVDSWLDFSNKRDFTNDRCHSVEIMYSPYFLVWPPEPLREAIVGKSIDTCFVVKMCLTYRCSFLSWVSGFGLL